MPITTPSPAEPEPVEPEAERMPREFSERVLQEATQISSPGKVFTHLAEAGGDTRFHQVRPAIYVAR
jgi:hypothetical protein